MSRTKGAAPTEIEDGITVDHDPSDGGILS
jgi:hypothetical protein